MISVTKKLAPVCVTAATACLLALAGCGSSDGLTGGVAATVNGTEIPEDKVTTYIMDLREAQSITTDKEWANWLNSSGYTPSSLREAVVDMFITQELEKEAAAKNGIEVSDDEVNAVVESMKSNYDTDEAWQNALSSAGLTEESYRENVYLPMLEEKLEAAMVTEDDAKADDETVLTYVTLYASSLDGMKRSSHILFSSDDEATAQQVLAQLNGGADFASMAQQYSSDSSGAKGGDVGWDKLSSFVSAYQEALDGLGEGEMSGLVTSEYGIHIIKCTDVWNAPEEITSLDQVPAEVVEIIRTQMADPSAKQSAFSTFIQGLRDEADIHINDMPANVPYNVDMDRYVSKSSSEGASSESSSASGESSSESSGAADEAAGDSGAEGSSSSSASEGETEGSSSSEGESESSSSASEASSSSSSAS